MHPENIHTHPWKVIGNSEGCGRCEKPKFLKVSMELNWNFQSAGEGCMDIFSNKTIYLAKMKRVVTRFLVVGRGEGTVKFWNLGLLMDGSEGSM